MIFFPLYITAWASSLLLNVNNNNNKSLILNPYMSLLNLKL